MKHLPFTKMAMRKSQFATLGFVSLFFFMITVHVAYFPQKRRGSPDSLEQANRLVREVAQQVMRDETKTEDDNDKATEEEEVEVVDSALDVTDVTDVNEHESVASASKDRLVVEDIPIVLIGLKYNMNKAVPRSTIPFMCKRNRRIIILSDTSQSIENAPCLSVEKVARGKGPGAELPWPKGANPVQKVFFERWYVLRDWMREAKVSRVFTMDSDAMMVENVTALMERNIAHFKKHEFWLVYNPPRTSVPFFYITLRGLEDITSFWNKLLLPDVWTKEFVTATAPNDMVAIGHYAHSAVGRPYPCWGYGPGHAPGSCDGTIDYGFVKVLNRMEAKGIRAKYPPGTLTLDEHGLAKIPEGVVDNNYRHDPIGRYESVKGSKQLRFVRGTPQMKLRTGEWVRMWGYILEDSIEACAGHHVGHVERADSCTCSNMCCKSCVPLPDGASLKSV